MLIKARIKACAQQARLNAHAHGGDDSEAANDLLCAFALICLQNDADPEVLIEKAWPYCKQATTLIFASRPVN
ncbi:MAG: hypothetical protein JXQ79_06045 [Rhodobacteraceae bacterium]|nr:hypothetical protein [Paracoccaceae bacterium]